MSPITAAYLGNMLLGLAIAAPLYAGMRYQRPRQARAAFLAAALVFTLFTGFGAFSTWSTARPDIYGEAE